MTKCWSCQSSTNSGLRLWVPAFAGTTAEMVLAKPDRSLAEHAEGGGDYVAGLYRLRRAARPGRDDLAFPLRDPEPAQLVDAPGEGHAGVAEHVHAVTDVLLVLLC